MLDLLNPNDKNPSHFVVKFNHAQIIILVFLQYTSNM